MRAVAGGDGRGVAGMGAVGGVADVAEDVAAGLSI